MKARFFPKLPFVLALIALTLTLMACGTVAPPAAISSNISAPTLLEEATAVPAENAISAENLPELVNAAADNCENPVDAYQPYQPEMAEDEPEAFSWLLFLYLNCPAQSGTNQPLTWETWKPNYAVYLPGGQLPQPWSAPLPPRVLLDQREISGHRVTDTSGQPILYEIRLNEATFDYIVTQGFYSKQEQINFFNDPGAMPVEFPEDAIEIKAAWIILDPNDPNLSHYYTIESEYTDSDGVTHQVLVGLAGFHITSKVLPNWLWATFEQVDNAARTDVPERVPTSPAAQEWNTLFHDLLGDSVWQYYDLRGAQIDFVNPDGTPSLLANTLIETDFQTSSSCITCHGLATRGSASQGRLGFWNVTDEGIQGYVGNIDDPANQYYDSFGDPVCFDESAWVFTNCDQENPVIVYKTMDFVWSLREAQ